MGTVYVATDTGVISFYSGAAWFAAGGGAALLSNQARGHFAAGQGGGVGGRDYAIGLDTIDYDPHALFNGGTAGLNGIGLNSTQAYVCPSTGYYLATAQVVGSGAGTAAVTLQVNNLVRARGQMAPLNTQSTLSDILKCNTNDTIRLGIQTGTGNGVNGSGDATNNFIAICQVA